MTCLHNIRYKKLYDNKVFPLGSTEKLLSSTQNDTFSNPRRYAFLLKDAKILGKMFEAEEDKKGVSSLARCVGQEGYTFL